MKTQTQRQHNRAERKAYRVMDALQSLYEDGYDGYTVERAMTAVRNVISKIDAVPIRERKEDAGN